MIQVLEMWVQLAVVLSHRHRNSADIEGKSECTVLCASMCECVSVRGKEREREREIIPVGHLYLSRCRETGRRGVRKRKRG